MVGDSGRLPDVSQFGGDARDIGGPGGWVQPRRALIAEPDALTHATEAEMAKPAALPKLTFSTREVAAMLGVSRPTVDRLVADGRLPSVDLGPTRRTLIPAWAVEELVARPSDNPMVS